MDQRHIVYIPTFCALVMLLSFSTISAAESFIASVKVTLIDPTTLNQEQLLHFGAVKTKPNGTCTIDPKNGERVGNACNNAQTETSVIKINGKRATPITINLNSSQSKVEPSNNMRLVFSPTLFNGIDSQHEFILKNTHHAVNLGGTLTQTVSSRDNSTPEQSTVSVLTLPYDVEVIYP